MKNKIQKIRLLGICIILISIAHIQAFSQSCITSSADYQSISFENQFGTFEVSFDATPFGSPIDVVVGLSNYSATGHSDVACGVRFRNTGNIVVRNGGAWDAVSTIPYTANTSYRFRMVVDVPSHTFSVYVTPEGGSELTVGADFAFRTEQAGVGSLAYWNIGDVEGKGTAQVCNFSLNGNTTVDPCMTSSSSYLGRSFDMQSGTFEGTFDATPLLASIDVVAGFSSALATEHSDMACGIRFKTEGVIVARNGDAWGAASTINYDPNSKYTFRFVVDVTARTYSVYVTPEGESEVPVGINYAFRAEQADADNIAYWIVSDVDGNGTATVCNLTINEVEIPTDTCVTSSSNCQNSSFESQNGTFEATFKATPLNGTIDVAVGLSPYEASSAAGMSCIIRFTQSDIIIGRDGGSWNWDHSIPYTANTTYLFRFVVDVAANTYSIYATPEGGREVKIGTDYAFRAGGSNLAYWSIVDVEGHGTVKVCDFAIDGVTAVNQDIALNTNSVSLSAYPNPSSGKVRIKYTLREPGEIVLSLYNILGEQLTTIEKGYKEKGIHEVESDFMTGFTNGIYYVSLVHRGESKSYKLIKQGNY